MRDPLPSLRDENPAIPQSIENIIMRATAKNPKNRYEDTRTMHDDLLTALDDERMNEEPIKFKYPEHEETPKKRKVEEKNEPEIEEVEEVAAKVEEDADDKKNKVIIIILAVILVLLIAGLIVAFVMFDGGNEKDTATIPDCEGMKVSACEKKLMKLGFEVNTKIELVESETIEKNKVVKTDPEAGRNLKIGTKVTIYKSVGEEVYVLEDYTGKNYIEVETLLESMYKLEVEVEKKEPADNTKDYDEQEVIGQSLAAGSEVKEGDKVILYIPDITDEFPNMNELGWSLADAEAFCTKYGIIIKVKYVETDKYTEGKIISQSRAAGSPVARGTTLTVEIAKKPDPNKPAEEDEDKNTSTDSGTGSSSSENAE